MFIGFVDIRSLHVIHHPPESSNDKIFFIEFPSYLLESSRIPRQGQRPLSSGSGLNHIPDILGSSLVEDIYREAEDFLKVGRGAGT